MFTSSITKTDRKMKSFYPNSKDSKAKAKKKKMDSLIMDIKNGNYKDNFEKAEKLKEAEKLFNQLQHSVLREI